MIMRIIILLILLCFSSISLADELRPAYIELNQKKTSQWEVVWKASAASPLSNASVIIPNNCEINSPKTKKLVLNNSITNFMMSCNGSIFGQRIGLHGLEFSNSDALVRIAALDEEIQTSRLTPNENITIISAPKTDIIITNIASSYIGLGFEHILEGYDHLLFVLALILLIGNLRLTAITVTAFTLAHTITLIGTTLGYFALPPQPVEAVIALSIVFLALEVVQSLRNKQNEIRLSERYPWVIAFIFGLLHGFGFAGALAEIGLPQNDVALALLTFNLGVELGQLLIVLIAIILLKTIERFNAQLIKSIKIVGAYMIGILATYWFIERMIS